MADPVTPSSRSWTRFTVVLVLVSLALSLPALLSGFFWDDYYFSSRLIVLDAPFGYYDFGDKLSARELAPWWSSANFRISFVRPLSSLTLYVDFHLLGGHPLVAHLHSAAWFVVLLLGVVRLLRTLLSVRVAKWAAVVFAISACHAFTLGWIAARHAVVGGALSVWAVVFYLQYRRLGARRDAGVALALFVLGLLSSETALAVAAVVVAYEVAGAQGRVRQRLAAAAPVVVTAVVYFIAYKATGHGAYGSSLYADPLLQPGSFLLGVVPKTVSIIGMYVLGVPTSWSYMPGMARVPLLAGAISLVLLAAGLALTWRRLDEPQRRLLRWLGLATLLAAVPSMASMPQGRSVLLSTVAFAGIAGLLVTGLLARREDGARRKLPLAVALVLCVGLVVLSPLIRLGLGAVLYKGSQSQVTLARDSKLACRPGARVYLVNGGLMFSLGAPFVVAHHRGVFFRGWYQLTEPATDIRVERGGTDHIIITARDKPLVNGFMLRLLRSRIDDLTRGKTIKLKGLEARVMKSSAAGPTQMEFRIPGLRDPDQTCLLSYDGARGVFRTVTLPGWGKALTIKWTGPKL